MSLIRRSQLELELKFSSRENERWRAVTFLESGFLESSWDVTWGGWERDNPQQLRSSYLCSPLPLLNMASEKRKRQAFTIDQEVSIICSRKSRQSEADLAQEHELPSSPVSIIWKNLNAIIRVIQAWIIWRGVGLSLKKSSGKCKRVDERLQTSFYNEQIDWYTTDELRIESNLYVFYII